MTRLLPLVLLGALACNACGAKEPVELPNGFASSAAYYDYGAFTVIDCSRGYPIYFVRNNALRSQVRLRITVAHEEAHLTTARVLGCDAYNALRSTLEGRITVELAAFCAAAAQTAREGTPYDEAIANAAEALSLYEFELTKEDAEARLWKMCP